MFNLVTINMFDKPKKNIEIGKVRSPYGIECLHSTEVSSYILSTPFAILSSSKFVILCTLFLNIHVTILIWSPYSPTKLYDKLLQYYTNLVLFTYNNQRLLHEVHTLLEMVEKRNMVNLVSSTLYRL